MFIMGDKMEDKSKLITIILVIITVIVVALSYIFNQSNNKEKEKEVNIVTNYSNFYTVNSCLYRVITYISSRDSETLLTILDDKYKKENKINEDNVMELFTPIEADSTFVSKKMYYQKINNNIAKYYVYGNIEQNLFTEDYSNNNLQLKEAYFIVYLDSTNKTFSIEPYSGEMFIGGE